MFLLRFQEHCSLADVAGADCGTQTATKIIAEQPDTDPSEHGSAIPRTRSLTGTQTMTEIKTEAPDADPNNYSAAPSAGTKTLTAVRAEPTDSDWSGRHYRAIPSCSSF